LSTPPALLLALVVADCDSVLATTSTNMAPKDRTQKVQHILLAIFCSAGFFPCDRKNEVSTKGENLGVRFILFLELIS
jgi:hypothetical protein